jgi:hypothetical protein
MSDERKYRQRGYQDSGRSGEGARRGPQPPREKREGPRGRGLGAPTETAFRCASCGAKLPHAVLEAAPAAAPAARGEAPEASAAPAASYSPAATCPHCGADLHTCSNCLHFDTGSRWECRRHAAIPERVVKKRARNSCPVFSPKAVQEFGGERERPADPRAAFDALFK